MQSPKKISCLIVDDEPPAVAVIYKFVSMVPTLVLVGTCNNALDAMALLREKEVDLIFLDIELPQIKGTDFIKVLDHPPKVIFTTAYRKYALEGFELDAVDYLLKPISFERFLRAVNKAFRPQHAAIDGLESAGPGREEKTDEYLCVRSDRKMMKLALSDIVYVESIKDYVKIFTLGKTIITRQSISHLEDNLPKKQFVRIHRSYIIALNKVQSFTQELVELGNYSLPISRLYRQEAEKKLRS